MTVETRISLAVSERLR